MSHFVYKTDALVFGGTAIGESNRFIDLFTHDLGRVHAIARSVRAEKSKLRFALQDYSRVHVSLVRGREVWRIVGAFPQENIYLDLRGRTGASETAVRLFSLVRRLLNGEEENRELFTMTVQSLSFLRCTELNEEELNNFECLVALRILYNLGYLAKNEHNRAFLDTTRMDYSLVSDISPLRFSIIRQINTSLEESQL